MYLLHVSNKLELAMKIKNIELTFPEEGVNIDPHLKVSCIAIQIVVNNSLYPVAITAYSTFLLQHLLKRMLAKDYRTRITLEEIAVDDWVTSEGSQVCQCTLLLCIF